MAITVGENGYLTVAEYKTWADGLGYDYSSKTDEQIEQSITISGVYFIDTEYKFKGDKMEQDQLMSLPTDKVSISDIFKGAAQAAYQSLEGKLFIDVSARSEGQVKKQRDKLDVLETETEYVENSQATYTNNTTLITKLLSPYTVYSGGACWGRG